MVHALTGFEPKEIFFKPKLSDLHECYFISLLRFHDFWPVRILSA